MLVLQKALICVCHGIIQMYGAPPSSMHVVPNPYVYVQVYIQTVKTKVEMEKV